MEIIIFLILLLIFLKEILKLIFNVNFWIIVASIWIWIYVIPVKADVQEVKISKICQELNSGDLDIDDFGTSINIRINKYHLNLIRSKCAGSELDDYGVDQNDKDKILKALE